MTKKGIRVFKGAKRWPYRRRDFTSLRRGRRYVNRSDRVILKKLEHVSSSRFLAKQTTLRLRDRNKVDVRTPVASAFAPLPPPRPRQIASVRR